MRLYFSLWTTLPYRCHIVGVGRDPRRKRGRTVHIWRRAHTGAAPKYRADGERNPGPCGSDTRFFASPLIVLTPRAGRQVRALRRHYEGLGRPEATRNLIAAIQTAWDQITVDPAAELPARRPYPQLARPGRAWVQAGRYWIAYVSDPPRRLSPCSTTRPTSLAACSRNQGSKPPTGPTTHPPSGTRYIRCSPSG